MALQKAARTRPSTESENSLDPRSIELFSTSLVIKKPHDAPGVGTADDVYLPLISSPSGKTRHTSCLREIFFRNGPTFLYTIVTS